ncbi:hypothetical protein [Citrobacter europaeus]|uniref:hypothetical protein n=2 Tax=Enterobacteriaceae TaxID=543 RepID=UPI003364D2FE
MENMPRNFFNILRDNPESWGGKQNPLTLPTTRSSDKAQKSSATVKISAVRFLCYKTGLSPSGLNKSAAFLAFVCNLSKVIHLHVCCYNLASRQAHPQKAQRALFYVKTN